MRERITICKKIINGKSRAYFIQIHLAVIILTRLRGKERNLRVERTSRKVPPRDRGKILSWKENAREEQVSLALVADIMDDTVSGRGSTR